jgi:hypothetical protein
MELVNISTYRDPSHIKSFHVFMTLETNATAVPDDCTDVFQDGAQLVRDLTDNVDFAIAYDDTIRSRGSSATSPAPKTASSGSTAKCFLPKSRRR